MIKLTRLLYSFICVLVLIACHQTNEKNAQLSASDKVIASADSVKFQNVLEAEGLLNSISQQAEKTSLYYLVKAYVALDKCQKEEALSYADSCVLLASDEMSIAEMQARSSLLKALVYSDTKEMDKAYYYYLLALPFLESSNYHYETFITLLGIVRIKDDVNQECSSYFRKAEKLQKSHQLNKGIYLRYLSRFTDKWEKKLQLWKSSEDYYRRHKMDDRLFASYCSDITFYINRGIEDSVRLYVHKAEGLGGGERLPKVKNKRKARFYYSKAWLNAKVKDNEQALAYLQEAITFADDFKQDDVLFIAYLMQSQVLESIEKYDQALRAHQCYVYHRKLYFDKTAHDKINIINIEYEDKSNAQVLETMKQSRKIHLLTIFLISLLVILLVLITWYLYKQRDAISTSFSQLREKSHSDKRQLAESNSTLESIKRTLDDPTKSYSNCYNDLKKLVESAKDESLFYDTIFDNEEFRQIIFNQFQKITESEYKYIVCVYMHYDRKRTAEILGIKLESLKSKEKRLKKKLNVGPEMTLRAYILSIVSKE